MLQQARAIARRFAPEDRLPALPILVGLRHIEERIGDANVARS